MRDSDTDTKVAKLCIRQKATEEDSSHESSNIHSIH